ncbi:hypothetical protein PMAYCL1PPCAC_30251, partial [Pristionchus mayeri]
SATGDAESPVKSQHTTPNQCDSKTPVETTGGPSKGTCASPANTGTGTSAGNTELTGRTTPQSSTKREDKVGE